MMKVRVLCGQCLYGREGGLRPSDLPLDFDLEDAPFSAKLDDHCYDLKCKNGHSIKFLLANEKFEVLFDYACHAVIDGYYREAVVAFAASLERFYEFSLWALLSREVPESAFKVSWDLVKSSSGKQLGAIAFVYLSATKQLFPRITKEQDGLRNQVVHKGKFPTRDEAVGYGESVRSSINTALKGLKNNLGFHLIEAYDMKFDEMEEAKKMKKRIRLKTILDVRDGPDFPSGDPRAGTLERMIERLSKSVSFTIGL